jgi:hypothetical protein
MQHFYRLLMTGLIFLSAAAHALPENPYYFFADILYWKATEIIDWAYDNDLNPVDQNISYQSTRFNFEPGFRLGLGYGHDWDAELYYTNYSTDTTDSASGNLKSGFFGGTAGLPAGHPFYNNGHFKMAIDLKMIDATLGKRFEISPRLMLHPSLGLEGGWINQAMRADLQGYYLTSEVIHNDFSGIGPKFGIDGSFTFLQHNGFDASLVAGFSTAYLWGHWDITDVYQDNSPRTIDVDLADRNMGGLVFQGMLGFGVSYHGFSVELSYEINDWFEQCQIFDDATGAHNNDLILQGLTLQLAYHL